MLVDTNNPNVHTQGEIRLCVRMYRLIYTLAGGPHSSFPSILEYLLTMRDSLQIRKLEHGTDTTLSTKRFDTLCRQFHLLMVSVNREK